MALQLISPSPDTFEAQLSRVCTDLLYPSETDMECIVYRFAAEEIGERFSTEDATRVFFPDQDPESPLNSNWAMMERFNSEGYTNFFRHFADNITQGPGSGEFQVWEPAHRERAEQFRQLRDLFMNHLVHQRWFRFNLADGVTKTIIIAGQLLKIEVNDETGELLHAPSDWFAVVTGTVET